MKVVIKYLDDFLTRTGKHSIDPVEANFILAKAGILLDSKERPGKPLRELLRKGKLPPAFQSGGKGTSWTIPHSSKHSLKSHETNALVYNSNKDVQKNTKLFTSKVPNSLFDKMLMNEDNFKSPGSIDNVVSCNPGLYCIRISNINKLPEPFKMCLAERQHNIMYIGVASKSLKKRFLNQELRANGHGTFFRSLGAILGYRPPKGSLVNKGNKRNYKFSLSDEQKIITWINSNLIVNWVDYNGDYSILETEMIHRYRPLINLSKNPSAFKLISDLRKECVHIANLI